MILVNTTARRLAALGAPYRVVKGALVADDRWARANLVRVPLPGPLPLSWDPAVRVSTVLAHKALAAQLIKLFRDLTEAGLWSRIHDYGGSYNVRAMRGTKAKPSAHCWGLALDFNTREFPQGSHKRWSKGFVKLWSDHGFINGAEFKRPDPMHFEARSLWP